MTDHQTHSQAVPPKAAAPKAKVNGDTAAKAAAEFRLPDFTPGLAAATDSWSVLMKAVQTINREQALVLSEEATTVSAEMEALRQCRSLPDAANAILKCAQLQSDLAIHGSRIAADIARRSTFEILSIWSQAFKNSPLSSFSGPHLLRQFGSDRTN